MSGKPNLQMTSNFKVPPQVVARAVGNETVLLDLAAGTYYGLDSVGARMWTLMGQGKSLAEVCDVMVEEYDVGRESLEKDVLALAGDLAEKNLVAIG